MRLKTRMCQGVIGIIIIITMATMVLYKKSASSSASSMPHHSDPATQKPARPQSRQASTLGGYIGVEDHKRLQMHCDTCSLVVSSGHLIRSERGEEIERSECAIRMNDAPTLGHQRDVGRRTDLRVVAHSSLPWVLQTNPQLLNASLHTVFIFWGPSDTIRQLLKKVRPKLKGYIMSQSRMKKFEEQFKKETGRDRAKSNSWMSTGWFTLGIALEMCDRINVFGMVPPDFCRSSSHPSVPYHYYEPLGQDECAMYLSHERGRTGSHRYITEKAVFAKWAQTSNIHFYQPDWKPAAANGTNNSVIPGTDW
ncbi:alpha-N-acetylgalactosaminide alpha-2,6-sialyltransferase 5b [Genypterus blacodes]|uniref:alpha-N-acetylgalactosaminide alpha-2,6-sialyltransferase 5b n=1 Tax=Genypterus blacodes TaxID=154954 RepID=UPI003F763269